MAAFLLSLAYEVGHGFAAKMEEVWNDFFHQSSEKGFEFATDGSNYLEFIKGENFKEPKQFTNASLYSKFEYQNLSFFVNLSSHREANVFGIYYLPSSYKRLLISSMIKENYIGTSAKYKYQKLLEARVEIGYEYVTKRILATGAVNLNTKNFGLNVFWGSDEIKAKCAINTAATTQFEASFQGNFATKEHAIGVGIIQDIKDLKLGAFCNNLAFERQYKRIAFAGELSKDYMGSRYKIKAIVCPFSNPRNGKIGFEWEII